MATPALILAGCFGGSEARGREEDDSSSARGLGSSDERNLPVDTSERKHAAGQEGGRDEPREVTGAGGDAHLTFVTLILKASRYWPMAEDG